MRKQRSILGRLFLGFAFLLAAVVAVLLFVRPADEGADYDAYFKPINAALRARGVSRPAVFVDLDRVDENLAVIAAQIRPPRYYRIVDKSLPSLELIRYVMEKTGTRRIMSFHEPYLSILFRELGQDVDYLLGKPMPVQSARDFYAGLPTDSHPQASLQVQWLVDTEQRLGEYLALADEFNQRFRVNLEIDVGLHRGGAKNNADLEAMLSLIERNPARLRFSGFMGYDGHLPHAPAFLGSHEAAVRGAFDDLVAKYDAFVAYATERYPAWFTGDVTLNGAGSKTYQLYTDAHPLNDLAMGSCVVKPSAFDEFTLASHVPAMFIAAPILKTIEGFEVPFLDAVAPLAAWWNPNWRRTYYVYGGAWSESVVAPTGIRPNAMTTSAPNENLFPNQNMLNGPASMPLDIGDFVFYRPKQGDAMFQFETIFVTRGGKVVDEWKPLPHRL